MPHFEIHATDTASAQSFYSGLLGWTFEPMETGDDMDYFLASGTGIGMETGLTVGLIQRIGEAAANGSPVRGGTMTFEVGDVDAVYAWALDNGGAEALPPTDYPGIGRAACCEDGQGNIVGLITPVEGN